MPQGRRLGDELVVDRRRATLAFSPSRLGVRVMDSVFHRIECLERRDGDDRPRVASVERSYEVPARIIDRKRARLILDDLLAELPEELRAVFVLYEIEGITVPEIAQVLDLAPGTTASRLRRAREAFERGVERHRARQRFRSEQAHGLRSSPSSSRDVSVPSTLLEEASSETGTALAKAKTLAALDLAGTAAAGGVAVGGAGPAGGAGSSTTAVGAATSAASGVGLALKVTAGVVVAGIVGSSVVLAHRVSTSSPVASPVHALSALVPAPALGSSTGPADPVEALPSSPPQLAAAKSTSANREPPRTAPSATSLPNARRTPARDSSVSAVNSTTQATAPTLLVEEAAALELARQALVAGRAASALAALDGYDQRFPRGELRPEATALRVEALLASENPSEARALGYAFLAKHSRHPAAARVRRALGETTP